MPNVLEVQIIGDVSALEKSLKEAEKLQAEYTQSIKDTSDEIAKLNKQKISDKKLGLDVAPINKQISKLQDNLVDLRGNLTKAGFAAEKAFTSISKSSGDTKESLSEVDDAAKETSDSILDMAAPIAQASDASDNMTLGVELLTSALAGGLAGAATFAAGKLVDMYLESARAATAFEDSIEKANEEAAKSASSQISSFKAYADAAQDANIPLENRLIAVKKLRDIAPYYLKDLSDEQILYGNLSGVISNVTTALLAQARAKAYGSLLDEKAVEQIKLFTDIQKELNAAVKNFEIPIDQVDDFQKAIKGGTGSLLRYLSSVKKAPITPSDFIDFNALENLSQKYKDLGKLNVEAYRLGLKIGEETKTALPLDFTEPPKVKATKDKDPKILSNSQKLLDKLKEIAFQMEEATSVSLFDIDEKTTANVDKLADIAFQMQEVTSVPLFAVDEKTEENLNKLKELAEEMSYTVSSKFNAAKEAADIFAQGTSSAIGALGSELASSLETGNAALDAFVGSVIQGLAEVAAAQIAGLIAKQAIATASLSTDAAVATGNAVVAGSETAAASGPAAAFVLPALVGAAIGFIAASFAGIKFAHGGIVPGGSYTGDKIPAMLNSGEAVLNSQQQANTLMAVANGNANSLQGNRQSSNFTLETKLRGSDLLLGIKREERKR